MLMADICIIQIPRPLCYFIIMFINAARSINVYSSSSPSPVIPLVRLPLLRRRRPRRTSAFPHAHRARSDRARFCAPGGAVPPLARQIREVVPEAPFRLIHCRLPLRAASLLSLDEPVEAVLCVATGGLSLARELRRCRLCLLGEITLSKLMGGSVRMKIFRRTRGGRTCFAVGWMYPSFTVFAVLDTVLVNHPKPLLIAAMGSFCISSKFGIVPALAFAAGSGALPKPAYLPPWLGGRSAGREAFSAPSLAKYLSSTLALFLLGLSLRLVVPLRGVPVRDMGFAPAGLSGPPAVAAVFCAAPVDVTGEGFAAALDDGLFAPATNSVPSTLQLNLSFHSSPTSPL